jgi:predicted transcriptional regulator
VLGGVDVVAQPRDLLVVVQCPQVHLFVAQAPARGRGVVDHDLGSDHPPTEYDNRMKRITVSLPDELVDKIRRAAGGERQVSSYVATALEDYQERENLDDILAAWRAETPVPEEVRQEVEAELNQAGLTGRTQRGGRMAG